MRLQGCGVDISNLSPRNVVRSENTAIAQISTTISNKETIRLFASGAVVIESDKIQLLYHTRTNSRNADANIWRNVL